MAYKQSFKTKRKMNKIGKIIAIVLAVLLGLGALSFLVVNSRERNPDNLIEVDDNYLVERNPGHGVEFEVDDDGVIKIKGSEATGNVEALIQTVELEAGTYTLSGIEKPNQDKMMLSAQWGSGEVCYAGLFDANGTFTLTEKTTVTIVLNIMADTEIAYANKTIKPVLVKGEKVGSFYTETNLFNFGNDDEEK